MATEQAAEFQPGALLTRFVAPPFTVLDTRQGYWQERRRAWLSLGLQSELGRDGGLLSSATERTEERVQAEPGLLYDDELSRKVGRFGADYDTEAGENAWGGAGTSIFDPVLCELVYRWWAPEGGRVLDPFAGGSVRGIVASKLGHPYTGIDLSAAQLAANRHQADAILGPGNPVPYWIHGDSAQLETLLPAGDRYDLVMSCPPYYDLEVYSDDPADLSAMEWPAFMLAYDKVIEAACARLLPGRFAVFVVGEVRDPTGSFRGLVPYTIGAFQRAGLRYYNSAILVNAVGSLPVRVGRYMEATRKLGTVHQNVLCFLKGEPPRGWSYDRAAPPSPQLGLFEEAEPARVVTSIVSEPPAEGTPEWVADVEGMPEPQPWELFEEAATPAVAYAAGREPAELDAAMTPAPEEPEPFVRKPRPVQPAVTEHRATMFTEGCATCGEEPVGTFNDGSPRYGCTHPAFTLFSDEEAPPMAPTITRQVEP